MKIKLLIYLHLMVYIIFLLSCKKDNLNSPNIDNLRFLKDSSYNYSFEDGDSMLVKQTYYTYNLNNKQIYYANYTWDNTLNMWIGANRTEANYSLTGEIIDFKEYYWNYDIPDWFVNRQIEYIYDINGELVLETRYLYDRGIGDVILSDRTYNYY